MITINLLDWRSARRERLRQQLVAMMAVGVVGAIVLVLLGYTGMSNAVSNQQARNSYLNQQIVEIDQKIKEIEELEKVKQNLLARMRVIEELQSSRSATVHFFDELGNTLPDGITLTSIKQTGDSVELQGLADSNGRVSTYIKNLAASEWFDEPKLIVIKTSEKNKQRESQFTLQVKNLTKNAPAGNRKLAEATSPDSKPVAATPPAPGTSPPAPGTSDPALANSAGGKP